MRLAAIALLALPGLLAPPKAALAEPIGEVDTVFKWIGPDHKIVVDAYDDPEVAGVTCYVSRAKTGGIKGAVGLAEDKAEASIACLPDRPDLVREAHPSPGRDVQRAHLAGLQEAARGAHGGP
jgi:CreA protein